MDLSLFRLGLTGVTLSAFCVSGITAAPAASDALQNAPAASPTAKPKAEGEMADEKVIGTYKGKLLVGKLDPPAAFNLEDIQNFPEERLYPVLNNPVDFEEGRDFSVMMDFQEEQLAHPWIPEFTQEPFLTMAGKTDTPSRDWTYSVIDQGGATVWKQEGKGAAPASMTWNGEDKGRGIAAVDTVYIPQLSITNKEGYRRTFSGQPAQFSAIRYTDKNKLVLEMSAKRLFQERKDTLTKEGYLLLDKTIDMLREQGKMGFIVRPYDVDTELARARQTVLARYLREKLYVSESRVILTDVQNPDKRGLCFAVIAGGAE